MSTRGDDFLHFLICLVPWSSQIGDFLRWPTCLKYGKYYIKFSFSRFLASWLPRHLLRPPWLNFGANLKHFGEALEHFLYFVVIFEVLFWEHFLEELRKQLRGLRLNLSLGFGVPGESPPYSGVNLP